jgi:hypothetical protein
MEHLSARLVAIITGVGTTSVEVASNAIQQLIHDLPFLLDSRRLVGKKLYVIFAKRDIVVDFVGLSFVHCYRSDTGGQLEAPASIRPAMGTLTITQRDH